MIFFGFLKNCQSEEYMHDILPMNLSLAHENNMQAVLFKKNKFCKVHLQSARQPQIVILFKRLLYLIVTLTFQYSFQAFVKNG